MASRATDLEEKIAARIEREGPITFRDFMEAALYDADHGYYNTTRLKIGPGGDYYTSSNVHSAFGAVLAQAFAEMWTAQSSAPGGHPDRPPLTIVEIGAGTGQLACDLMMALRDEHKRLFDLVKYIIVESSRSMREIQRERLAEFDGRVSWQSMEKLQQEGTCLSGIFFSNELLDAMPVHRVRVSGWRLEELYVTTARTTPKSPRASGERDLSSKRGLALTWGEPSSDRLERYIARMGVWIGAGRTIEINLEAIDWLERVSRLLKSGYVVTIDYGDVAARLYTVERRNGTLRCFYRHRLIESPLERVGEQDITASVNFTALIEYGREFGLEFVSLEGQTAFLVRMGLIDRIAALAADLRDRLALKNLFVPGGISDSFRVLVQRKG